MKAIERLYQYMEYKGLKPTALEKEIGLSNGYLGVQRKRNADMGEGAFLKIIDNCRDINPSWLLTGEGDMFREDSKEGNTLVEPIKKKNLIPFYDDVASIGGVNTISATMEGHMPSNEWIDAGDWFIDATAAIRHYGNSMIEYPSGCILALKELHDQRQIIWGRNYCIETDEMRVTKRLQAGTDEYLMAYSTNTETYPDGHLIHEPFRIYKDTIRRIFMVIGCVIKEYSSGPVIIKNT
jgi:hypothetical protein